MKKILMLSLGSVLIFSAAASAEHNCAAGERWDVPLSQCVAASGINTSDRPGTAGVAGSAGVSGTDTLRNGTSPSLNAGGSANTSANAGGPTGVNAGGSMGASSR